MRRFLKALVFVSFGGFLGGAAAAPVLLYQFQTTGMTCQAAANECSNMLGARANLDRMYVGLNQSAVDSGAAHLKIRKGSPDASDPVINMGFESMATYFYKSQLFTEVPEHGYVYPAPNHQFFLDIALQLGDELLGSIDTNNTSSELEMWSTSSGWEGFIRSDALSGGIFAFTGVWVNTVPEPRTAVLLLLALAAMAMMSRSRQGGRARRAQVKVLDVGLAG